MRVEDNYDAPISQAILQLVDELEGRHLVNEPTLELDIVMFSLSGIYKTLFNVLSEGVFFNPVVEMILLE